MKKVNWTAVAKHAAYTGGEVAVLTGGIILTKKFLDFKVLFKKKIEQDPTYAEKFHIKHQGLIKLGVGSVAACFIKNPWLRMLAIGVAVEGAITEARLLTTDKEGVSFFDQIGADDQASIDAEMRAAAEGMQGTGEGNDFGNRFQTTVGAGGTGAFYDRFVTSVGFGDDLDNRRMSATAGYWGG